MLSNDVYAAMHAAMFATVFGQWSPPLGFDFGPLERSLDSALAWTLFTDNFDLMAELMLGWAALQMLDLNPDTRAALEAKLISRP